jgi:hypothetical protein
MNTTVIVLGIIIVILLYVLYKYFTNLTTTLQSQASLNLQVPAISKINNATATRYAYSIWIYVNTWNTNVAHTIMSRQNNLRLYLDQYAPNLKFDIFMSDGKSYQTMLITDNFPLQKWTHIIISIDNQYVDAYLDGKLIQSHRFYTSGSADNASSALIPNVPPASVPPSFIPLPGAPPTASTPIYLGNSDITITNNKFQQFDAYVSLFNRWDSGPVDPQTAWSEYMKGNGTSILGALGNYGANITVLKNNIENSKLVLF